MHDSRSPAHVISIDTDTVAHGTPEMLRAVICEQLSFLAVNADLGRGHAQLGDDLALSYCVRRATASLRVVLATLRDLTEQFPQPAGRDRKQWTTSP
jgi:hypothetical protein